MLMKMHLLSQATVFYFDIRTMQTSADLRLDNVQHGLVVPGSSREVESPVSMPCDFGHMAPNDMLFDL
jgi:hypothetical protein